MNVDITPRPGVALLDDPAVDLHERLVADELRKLRARQRARDIFDAERRPAAEPFDIGTLADVLARPAPPRARIDRLIPWEASTLVVAERKAGKTTLVLNAARSLLTGEPFLGDLEVRKVDGTVALLNFEVSGAQIARWARDVAVPHDKLVLVNLRGRSNPFGDTRETRRLAAALRLHSVETLIVDPFGRAFTGRNQNDAGEVAPWLVQLDQFARTQVGALDLILCAHAGWNAERSRGSSALEDWPDSIINLTRDTTDDDGRRYLRALGRDIDLDEDALDFDHDTRTLTLARSGGRKHVASTRQDAEIRAQIIDTLQGHPDGLSGNQLAHAVGRKDVAFTKARDTMVALGDILRVSRGGRGGGSRYLINPNVPNLPKPAEPVGTEPTEPPFIGREVQFGEVEGENLPKANPESGAATPSVRNAARGSEAEQRTTYLFGSSSPVVSDGSANAPLRGEGE